MASNIDILNNITSTLYNERIPAATRTNLADIADAILNNTAVKNEVLTEIVNKIAFTIIRGTEYESIFGQFRGEDIVYGDTIEELQVQIPEGYDPRLAGTDPFGKVQPSVKACYHTINSEIQYKQTITDADFRKAVRSANGLDSLINNIISSMTDAMALDDDLKCLQVLSNTGVYGQLVYMGAATGTDATDAKTLVSAIKSVSSKMKFASNNWNFLRVLKQLPLNKQVLIMKAEWKDKIDLDFLAGVYNLNKVEIAQRIIEVDEFIGLEDVAAVLIDEKALMYHKSLQDGGMIYNPQGVPYTNHFLNSWGLYSFSLFANSAMFIFANYTKATLTVQSDDVVPVSITDYIVKDSDGRLMIADANGDFNLAAGTYSVEAEGYVTGTLTVTAEQAAVSTLSATVKLTAEA